MILHIVVPCYNESAVLQRSHAVLRDIASALVAQGKADKVRLVFVDDGSRDDTWAIVRRLAAGDRDCVGLKLSHNSGHQNALWAGMEWSVGKCDAVVTIDADLQDDPTVIGTMVDRYKDGYEVVLGVRGSRREDTAFKRHTAQFFYRFMAAMGVEIVYNHADFRLLGSNALRALMQYDERNIFLRGVVTRLGFKRKRVFYNRTKRMAGDSKYPLRKMLSFAVDGITSFSVKPLRMIGVLGFVVTFISIAAIIYALFAYFSGRTMSGWTSLLISLWFIGGVVLFSIGVVGEYIGKIYTETKRRPRYCVEEECMEVTDEDKESSKEIVT